MTSAGSTLKRNFKQHFSSSRTERRVVHFTSDDELVEEKRGFKPSDVHDPGKREFLTQLSKSMWMAKSKNLLNRRRVLIYLPSSTH